MNASVDSKWQARVRAATLVLSRLRLALGAFKVQLGKARRHSTVAAPSAPTTDPFWSPVGSVPGVPSRTWWSELPLRNKPEVDLPLSVGFTRPELLAAVIDGPSLRRTAEQGFGWSPGFDVAYDFRRVDRFDERAGFVLAVEIKGTALLGPEHVVVQQARPIALRVPDGFPLEVAQRALQGLDVHVLPVSEFAASPVLAAMRRVPLDLRLLAALRLLEETQARRETLLSSQPRWTWLERQSASGATELARYLRLAVTAWRAESAALERFPQALIGVCWGDRHTPASERPSDEQLSFYAEVELH